MSKNKNFNNKRKRPREPLRHPPRIGPNRLAKLTASLAEHRAREEHAYRANHGRNDFYKYLEGIAETYWGWEADKCRKTRAAQLAHLAGVDPHIKKKALHVLVEATSKRDRDLRNRWVRGLQYVVRHREEVKAQGFLKFCLANGGIKGCADRQTAWKAAKQEREDESIGVLGRHRMPPNVPPEGEDDEDDDDDLVSKKQPSDDEDWAS